MLWYLDNVLQIRDNELGVDIVEQVDLFEKVDIQTVLGDASSEAGRLRELLFKQGTHHLSKSQLNQLSQLKGRNVELAYTMMTISNLVGIDTSVDLSKIFEQKATEETEVLEIGRIGILKDLLAEIWHEKKENSNYLTETGYVKVANKELFDRYATMLDLNRYPVISHNEFKAYLTELGFSDTVNRKNLKVQIPNETVPKSRLCNIFTPHVLKKLGIEATPASDKTSASNEEHSKGNGEKTGGEN